MAIWQDLVDGHGFTHAYASVRRFVAKLRGEHRTEACAIIVTAPGEEAQVDYGSGPMVRDRENGQVPPDATVRAHARLQPQSRPPAGVHARVRAPGRNCTRKPFARLGGTPRTIVLDNLREGVIKPDLYDPALNRAVRRRARALRRDRAAMPHPPPGS